MTEPKIAVTEGDRRAAAEASRRHVSPSIEQWIKDGVSAFHKFVPIDIGVGLEMNAIAIARARTMAAFEERVSCAFKLAQVCDEIQLSVVVGVAVDADQGPDMLTRDDIRALVIAGWEPKAP